MRANQPVLYWVRRDLRISDNTALFHASHSGAPVIPVYFPSQWRRQHDWTGSNRQTFLCGCLESLDRNLAAIGGRLIIRNKNVVKGLRELIRETGASAIHCNADPDPFGKDTETHVEALCAELGVSFHKHLDCAMHDPGEVLTQSGLPYRVYTPFSKSWLALPKPAPVGKPKPLGTPDSIPSDPLPQPSHWNIPASNASLPQAGERAARDRLRQAVNGIIQGYSLKRNFPALDGTSRLSQDLRFGLISIRTIHDAVLKARASANAAGREGADVFIKELAWREFYFSILHHFPDVLLYEFSQDWRGLPWLEPDENFERWKSGQTGFPIVDAGMRELLATGHMHNRVRMITAMFLTKDLHIDWRLGESHFMQHLIDGEIASNNGGWQWSAGTGADAAPYFRIQNPWSQTARYDPDGIYIKRWIPELAATDPAKFLTPPADGKPIAPGYPLPCVDHHTERERTLAMFKRHRE